MHRNINVYVQLYSIYNCTYEKFKKSQMLQEKTYRITVK